MIRHLLVPTLAAALCAGEAAPPPATVSIAIADGAILARHWDASLYGTVWNDPGMAWVRQQWAKQRAELKTAKGIDLDGLLAAATGVRGEFLGVTAGADPKPRLRVEADLGTQAAALFALLATEARPGPVAVPGADQACSPSDGAVLARHGSRLVFGLNCDAIPWPAGPVANDIQLRMDYRGFMTSIASTMPVKDRAPLERMLGDMDGLMGRLTWDIDLVTQGLHELITYDRPAVGAKPVDQAILDRFPADALAVAGFGVDLAAMWKVAGPSWLDSLDQAMHHGQRTGPEATQREVDAVLAGLGVAGGVQQLVSEVSGTMAVAVTQGVPFPGISLVVPRSPTVDALVAAGAARLEAQVPAEGASAILPIPNLPIMVTLARDRTHWLVSTDPQLPETWLSGKPGGFLGSPTGTAMLAKAGPPTYVLGGLDTAAALRVLTPYVTMGLSRGAPAEVRQAVMAGLARLTREATPSWLVVRGDGQADGSRTEAQGALGLGVAPIAIIAAIAIPNLMESRVAANEAAAGATLRSGVFPAQVQFQAGAYMDQDGDNVGEYGTLAELAGRQKTGKVEAGQIHLLMGPLAAGDTASGYRYRMFLPDGAGGAITSDGAPRAALPAAADAQERSFIVYAWPMSRETGRRMFALAADGQLRSQPWDGAEPAWNAALGDGWDGEPTWPADRGGRRRQRDDAPAPAPAPAADPKSLF